MTSSLHHSSTNEQRRYVTRQHKRSSEGIVAQITQNFAARMELKSPQTKEALSCEQNEPEINDCDNEDTVFDDGVREDNDVIDNKQLTDNMEKTSDTLNDVIPDKVDDNIITCELVKEKEEETGAVSEPTNNIITSSIGSEIKVGKQCSEGVPADNKEEVPADNKKEVTADKEEVPADNKEEVPADNKKEVTADKEEVPADDKEEVTDNKEEVPDDKEEVTADKEEVTDNKEEVTAVENLPRYDIHKDMTSVEILMVLNYNMKASLSTQAMVSHNV